MNNPLPNLRPGNGPFAYLMSHYDVTDPKVRFLVESLPRLAQDLSDLAETLTQHLVHDQKLSSDVDKTLLNHCVLDLLLTVLFQETEKYSGNNDLASLVVDSVLYQANGYNPSSPTEVDLMCGQTCSTRGIHKYAVARQQWPHIRTTTSWLFGKELATLKGESANIHTILSVGTFTVRARVYAKWSVERVFYGTIPTEEQREALEASLAEQDRAPIREAEE